MSERSQPTLWPETELPSMSSAAGSPARISASAEEKKESMANGAGCGGNMHALFARYDHDSHSWKTSEHLLFEDLKESLRTLPPAGLMQNGTLFLRQPSGRHMPEIGYGLLPTPNARDWKDINPRGAAYSASRARHQPSLVTRAYVAGIRGQALQRIYEWAMGFPALWTQLKPSATPSSRKSRK